MQIITSDTSGEFWGARFDNVENSLDITATELIDYLLEQAYDEIPDSVTIEFEGMIFEVDCWKVLYRQKAEVLRFHKEVGA